MERTLNYRAEEKGMDYNVRVKCPFNTGLVNSRVILYCVNSFAFHPCNQTLANAHVIIVKAF